MYKLKLNTSRTEPLIDQGLVHGLRVSWNPDTDRYHVDRGHELPNATFKDWRNAVQYARTHPT